MLTNIRVSFAPPAPVYVSAPRSIFRRRLPRITWAASSRSVGSASVRRKSPPVPYGITPRLASGAIATPFSKNPLTTSLIVPSPPIATTRSAPARSASRVSRVASPGPWVITSSNGNARPSVSATSVHRDARRPP